jgi:hypothetical protein
MQIFSGIYIYRLITIEGPYLFSPSTGQFMFMSYSECCRHEVEHISEHVASGDRFFFKLIGWTQLFFLLTVTESTQ